MKLHNELNKRANLVNWFGLNLRPAYCMPALSKLTAKSSIEYRQTLFCATHGTFSSNYFSPQCRILWRNYLTVLLTTIFLIACGGGDGAARYTVGGTLNGLAPGNSITVSNNGLDNITLTANGTFAFPTSLTNGSAYNISIVTLPTNQPCTYTYGAGTVTGANIGSINLFCGPTPINAWSAAGNLVTGRSSHTATLLTNGKVLITGGLSAAGILSSVELYDPATNTWSTAGNLLLGGRSSHTATLLLNGKVLIAGGLDCFGAICFPSYQAEIYDPATDIWSWAGSLAASHLNHYTATLLPNGKVLVADATAELYDPATNTWTVTGSLATARAFNTATLLPNGQVLVTEGGGAELYDSATNTWTATVSLATGRTSPTATLLPNGKVLVAGGISVTSTLSLASAELYDPATNAWTAAGSMTTDRTSHTATLLPNGRVLVAGGFSATSTLASAELYDPATNTWVVAGSLATARSQHAATLLQSGKLLVSGGWSGSAATPIINAELYW